MGATNISHTIRGKASVKDIEKAFNERRQRDREENGHREGYSGDFQTVSRVDTRYLNKEYPSYREAEEFCLDKAVKWETVVAVYFKGKDDGVTHTLLAGWGAE